MSVKLNGQELVGAVVRHPAQDNGGKLHGEFYLDGLRPTHSVAMAQSGAFGGPGGGFPRQKQSVGFTRHGQDIGILGASVEVDGKIGRIVAVSNERVEWEEV